ncbi:voltage-gated hydrogen channel 1 [Aplysia californica]|uniref:Voltage-gated hydrogen channel 1 n=1 Tax=Aplysia californica TaxID=6500 RepID=A0ABM0JSS7_APLCA|nr:voltage-gated hydrogen channel 1 [Aplysia californica]
MKLDGLRKMQDDLVKVIERDDTSTVTSDSDETIARGPKTLRETLDDVIHSQKFMVFIIVLVVLDCLMVIAELLFDLEIVKLGEEHHYIPKIFHYGSLGILSLFLIEIGLRIFVLRLDFFKHKLELFDAVVVIVSFILDIVFRDNEDAATGVGLLIILRLWRVTRIVNGIVLSVQKQAEKKIEREKHLREECEQELAKFREYCMAQEAEIEVLQGLLHKHNIEFTTNKITRPESRVQVDVVAEVNSMTAVAETDIPLSPSQPGEQEISLSSGDNVTDAVVVV